VSVRLDMSQIWASGPQSELYSG